MFHTLRRLRARAAAVAKISDEAGIVFSARATSHGAATPEPSEDLAVRWIGFDEALAMTMDGRITDAITIMGLQRVALDRATAPPSTGGDQP